VGVLLLLLLLLLLRVLPEQLLPRHEPLAAAMA
jgi:hypothetical protein